MIGGVSGGLSNYFDIDPTIVRVLFIVSIFLGGGGIIAYIILWIVLPEEPVVYQPGPEKASEDSDKQNSYSGNPDIERLIEKARSNKKVFGGTILIFLGILFLLDNFLPRFDFGDYWPLILIAVGLGIIIKSYKN
jgi:phage shock protein PspC (stress-responsive transcriptional regulator)